MSNSISAEYNNIQHDALNLVNRCALDSSNTRSNISSIQQDLARLKERVHVLNQRQITNSSSGASLNQAGLQQTFRKIESFLSAYTCLSAPDRFSSLPPGQGPQTIIVSCLDPHSIITLSEASHTLWKRLAVERINSVILIGMEHLINKEMECPLFLFKFATARKAALYFPLYTSFATHYESLLGEMDKNPARYSLLRSNLSGVDLRWGSHCSAFVSKRFSTETIHQLFTLLPPDHCGIQASSIQGDFRSGVVMAYVSHDDSLLIHITINGRTASIIDQALLYINSIPLQAPSRPINKRDLHQDSLGSSSALAKRSSLSPMVVMIQKRIAQMSLQDDLLPTFSIDCDGRLFIIFDSFKQAEALRLHLLTLECDPSSTRSFMQKELEGLSLEGEGINAQAIQFSRGGGAVILENPEEYFRFLLGWCLFPPTFDNYRELLHVIDSNRNCEDPDRLRCALWSAYQAVVGSLEYIHFEQMANSSLDEKKS